jgi:retinol dehydrogenase 12
MWTWIKEVFPGKPRWTAKDMPDLNGKVVCVTGGNTGIGYETCKALLEHNAKVYLAARSEERASAAISKLKKETGKSDIHWLKLDLGDIPSCAAAAKELASKERKLDILFNNAYVPFTTELKLVV